MSAIKGRLIINCDLMVKTGMHIGGGNNSIEIGGIDSSVIKTYKGEPYIPGSSLKGKLRSLTEIAYGKGENGQPCNCGKCAICKIYGSGANNKSESTMPTRIIVRDALLKQEIAQKMRNKEDEFKELEFLYTESKWENTIDRYSSKAMPRVLERVPEGTVFEVEVIYTIYDDKDIENLKTLKEGFEFLQDDYIGGSGTRGYGKIAFNNIKICKKTLSNYSKESIGEYASLDEIPADYIEKLQKQFND